MNSIDGKRRVEDELSLKPNKNAKTRKQYKKREESSDKFRKSPNAPKRFKTAFIYFTMEKHSTIRKEGLESGMITKTSDVARLISKAWKDLNPEQRSVYQEKADQDKKRWEREKNSYIGPWKIPKEKKPSKKERKFPTSPKRPPSAFLIFSNATRKSVKEIHGNITNASASKILSAMWHKLCKEEKQSFIDQEISLRQKYKDDMDAWKKANEQELERVRIEKLKKSKVPEENDESDNFDYEDEVESRTDKASSKRRTQSKRDGPETDVSRLYDDGIVQSWSIGSFSQEENEANARDEPSPELNMHRRGILKREVAQPYHMNLPSRYMGAPSQPEAKRPPNPGYAPYGNAQVAFHPMPPGPPYLQGFSQPFYGDMQQPPQTHRDPSAGRAFIQNDLRTLDPRNSYSNGYPVSPSSVDHGASPQHSRSYSTSSTSCSSLPSRYTRPYMNGVENESYSICSQPAHSHSGSDDHSTSCPTQPTMSSSGSEDHSSSCPTQPTTSFSGSDSDTSSQANESSPQPVPRDCMYQRSHPSISDEPQDSNLSDINPLPLYPSQSFEMGTQKNSSLLSTTPTPQIDLGLESANIFKHDENDSSANDFAGDTFRMTPLPFDSWQH